MFRSVTYVSGMKCFPCLEKNTGNSSVFEKLKKGDLVKGIAHETGDEYGSGHFFDLSK
jgi:hypothetical protein